MESLSKPLYYMVYRKSPDKQVQHVVRGAHDDGEAYGGAYIYRFELGDNTNSELVGEPPYIGVHAHYDGKSELITIYYSTSFEEVRVLIADLNRRFSAHGYTFHEPDEVEFRAHHERYVIRKRLAAEKKKLAS